MKRLTITLSPGLYTEIKLAAIYEDTTVSALVASVMRSYLAQQNNQPPRGK